MTMAGVAAAAAVAAAKRRVTASLGSWLMKYGYIITFYWITMVRIGNLYTSDG